MEYEVRAVVCDYGVYENGELNKQLDLFGNVVKNAIKHNAKF